MVKSKISQARFIRPDGTVKYVQPFGTELLRGNSYYDPHEAGTLLHITDDVPAKLVKSSVPSRSGSSSPDIPPYFRRLDRREIESERKRSRIDPTKGFRIHLNTSEFSEEFNVRSGAYEVSKGGKVTIVDNDLRNREAISIYSARDVLDLIKRTDIDRINRSKVIFRNAALDWDDFFVRPQANKGHRRFVELLDRIEDFKEANRETFCAMVLRTAKPFSYSYRDTVVNGQFLPIVRRDGRIVEGIQPKVFINSVSDDYLHHAFSRAGDYLVLGVPVVKIHTMRGEKIHHLGIKLETADAVQKIDWNEVLKITATTSAAWQRAMEASPTI